MHPAPGSSDDLPIPAATAPDDLPPYEDIFKDAMRRLKEQAATWEATVSAVPGWREVDVPSAPPADDLTPTRHAAG